MELLGALALAEFGRDCSSLDDLNAMVPDTVTGCHLIVHLLNSTIQCGVPVLLVHVVITSPALVPQPDAIVLDLCWFPLKYLASQNKAALNQFINIKYKLQNN